MAGTVRGGTGRLEIGRREGARKCAGQLGKKNMKKRPTLACSLHILHAMKTDYRTYELQIGDPIVVLDGPYRGMRGVFAGQRVGRFVSVDLEVWGRLEPFRAFVIQVQRIG